jgi:hypothetical protein
VWLRQDPPFDMFYITTTHLLQRIHPETLVVNDPFWVRNYPERLMVLDFPDLTPPALDWTVRRCLAKDREVLLAFYDFPAEHWIHLRTTNPIESTFATVRLRHRRTKGNGSRKACLTMVFKLVQAAEKKWRLLNGSQLIPDVIQGVRFIDGLRQEKAAA